MCSVGIDQAGSLNQASAPVVIAESQSSSVRVSGRIREAWITSVEDVKDQDGAPLYEGGGRS
jgi:hypothetical protein